MKNDIKLIELFVGEYRDAHGHSYPSEFRRQVQQQIGGGAMGVAIQ
jgi:hypothetical protein